MSAKAFYQTFFQTEQLFRRADDALAFPATYPLPAEQTEPSPEPVVLMEPIVIAINDPVMPTAFAPTQPVSEAIDSQSIVEIPAVPEPVQEPIPVVAIVAEDPSVQVPETPVVNPEATATPPKARKPATPQISQKVLILVDEELLPSDLLFLEKILKAVHLDIDGVDLLNVHGTHNVNFSELLSGKYIHHFFTFGVPFNRINLDILMDRYQPVRFDGITFLMADPLPAIETDVVLKKKLWEALKKVFLWR